MTDVPDETVMRGVENIMKGDCKLNDAERGTEMAARSRHGAESFPTELVGDLFEIGKGKALEVLWKVNGVKEWSGAGTPVLRGGCFFVEGGDGGGVATWCGGQCGRDWAGSGQGCAAET